MKQWNVSIDSQSPFWSLTSAELLSAAKPSIESPENNAVGNTGDPAELDGQTGAAP